jgi:hypothetical protein
MLDSGPGTTCSSVNDWVESTVTKYGENIWSIFLFVSFFVHVAVTLFNLLFHRISAYVWLFIMQRVLETHTPWTSTRHPLINRWGCAADCCKVIIHLKFEELYFLWYISVPSVESQQTFRRNISPPSLGLKRNLSKRPVTSCLLSSSCWFLAWLILQPWSWRWHVPPELRLNIDGLHDFIFHKTELFITTSVKTSNLHLKFIGKGLMRA